MSRHVFMANACVKSFRSNHFEEYIGQTKNSEIVFADFVEAVKKVIFILRGIM